MSNDNSMTEKVASRFMAASNHEKSIALMKFLSAVATRLGVAEATYVVGGAVRDFVLGRPIKDVDVVIDPTRLKAGRDSEWFAKQVMQSIPTAASLATNQYGVAIITVTGTWMVGDVDLSGQKIEIANSRSESYGKGGYKPTSVQIAPIETDLSRRELTFNTLLWRMSELADGPDKAEILDMTGCGMSDLKNGIMQCPSDPDKTFEDDPSRLIRIIKFALRYGFKLTPDTKAAILRQAGNLKNVPSSHLSEMLADIVLTDKNWKPALVMMADLHLLDPVRETLLSDESFRSAIQNHVNSSKMDMMFGLMDVGLPLGAKVGFLTPTEMTRVRELTLGMDRDEAWVFLGKLKNPGNAFMDGSFQPALAASHGVAKRDVGTFYSRVALIARTLMLHTPALADMPDKLKQLVSKALN